VSRLSNDGGWDGGFYVEGADQSLLRDGVEAFRASTVIAEPYVMANKSLHKLDTRRNELTISIGWFRPTGRRPRARSRC